MPGAKAKLVTQTRHFPDSHQGRCLPLGADQRRGDNARQPLRINSWKLSGGWSQPQNCRLQ